MHVKLTAPHLIDDVLHDRDEVLNVSAVTPLMIGLDAEAEGAIRAEKTRAFGRWLGRWPDVHLLDEPPLEGRQGD